MSLQRLHHRLLQMQVITQTKLLPFLKISADEILQLQVRGYLELQTRESEYGPSISQISDQKEAEDAQP